MSQLALCAMLQHRRLEWEIPLRSTLRQPPSKEEYAEPRPLDPEMSAGPITDGLYRVSGLDSYPGSSYPPGEGQAAFKLGGSTLRLNQPRPRSDSHKWLIDQLAGSQRRGAGGVIGARRTVAAGPSKAAPRYQRCVRPSPSPSLPDRSSILARNPTPVYRCTRIAGLLACLQSRRCAGARRFF